MITSSIKLWLGCYDLIPNGVKQGTFQKTGTQLAFTFVFAEAGARLSKKGARVPKALSDNKNVTPANADILRNQETGRATLNQAKTQRPKTLQVLAKTLFPASVE